MQRALRLDSANPYRWAECGIALDERGDRLAAQKFFIRAAELGSNTPPVLMVAANHYLLDKQPDRALELCRRVLSLTAEFDELLFATYGQLGRPLHDFLGTAIPVEKRPLIAWLKWLLPRAPEDDLIETWHWLRGHGCADDSITGSLAQELWRRHSCHKAASLWGDWLGQEQGDYLRPELLANRRFSAVPRPGPFDWTIEPNPSVEISLQDGLSLTFDGSENLYYKSIRQMAAVAPGTYRFSAVVESKELTTNQGLSFHIYDALSSTRLDFATPTVLGTTPRHVVEVDFTVVAPVCGVMVQLERRPSEKFDSKISGTFTIHEVSLRPLS
jgi:tetratricopeptide (TPR) repeat protein